MLKLLKQTNKQISIVIKLSSRELIRGLVEKF